ncbi:DUF368 domain-containing protein [Phocicoccus pinnipedialis]|uniref:DUF368 domain-containing protein n=1 Tax=Phocicoccus pinnipedialis TaxID=110845 RepID=A0A6V7R5V5_9BACL|nr:DUF368 domain-containing protein [Jeotgalicoccus pinnipedialis]MBP1939802.1 putative membrane protein [Jeotgalicoccus pinnipedialis]CAD2072434.1 hypothetical protein JEOPIN946_00523 [Jeotgalicoccus pinnipedialis]
MIRWLNIFRGFLMGIVELVPGISSGTLALLLGIYDELLISIQKLFTKDFKKAAGFVFPLIIGMAIAILSMSSIINYFLVNHTIIIHWFFLGLVFGVIPMMFKLGNYKYEFKWIHYILIFLTIIGMYVLNNVKSEVQEVMQVDTSFSALLFLFIAGFIGSMALVLPGLSGSVILLILGAYPIVIYAISEFTSFNFEVLPILFATGFGIMFGIIFASKFIHYLLTHYTYLTYAFIIGLLLGSSFPIFHGFPTNGLQWVLSVILFLFGLGLSYSVSRRNNKETI